jgi:hypothetical protein
MVSVNVLLIKPVGAGRLEDRQVVARLTIPGVLRVGKRRSRRRGYLA